MDKLIINYGSINIDHVYRVPQFVTPGETRHADQLETGLGGKGANQSVAIARAGGAVLHVGQLSKSDTWARIALEQYGVNVEHISLVDQASGHAIIQVDAQGENSILLHGGANQYCDLTVLERVLNDNPVTEYLLLQNECNGLRHAIELAHQRGIKIALNPAPMNDEVNEEFRALALPKVSLLIVNQVEASQLWGLTSVPDIVEQVSCHLPNTIVVLTLGQKGVVLIKSGTTTEVPAARVVTVDTTAAGDTFVGYFLSALVRGDDDLMSLHGATAAAALCVTKQGAIDAIPTRADVQQFMNA